MTPRKNLESKPSTQTDSNTAIPLTNSPASPKNIKQAIGVFIICLGIFSGLLFFFASIKFYLSGLELQELRSVGGTSIAEAYYQEMGKHAVGYAVMSLAFGLGIITISLGQGAKLIFETDKSAKA